jgi:ribosomal protein S11
MVLAIIGRNLVATIDWQEIKEQYKDTWVAMTNREHNDVGEITAGHVVYHNPDRKAFYAYLAEHFPPKLGLAVRYTGSTKSPIFLYR